MAALTASDIPSAQMEPIGVGDFCLQYVELVFGRRTQWTFCHGLEHGGVCLAGHFAAWDIALISLAQHYPVTIFLRQPSNWLARRLISYLRSKHDIEALYGRGVMQQAYGALQRKRLVIFVQDQRHNEGIISQFFGRPCKTSAAFATMAWRSQKPLFGIYQWQEHGEHFGTVERLNWIIPEPRQQAIENLTQATQDFYQHKIKQRPYSWLWLHRRWKL